MYLYYVDYYRVKTYMVEYEMCIYKMLVTHIIDST